MSSLIRVADALALIETVKPDPGQETVDLTLALGRTLAAPVFAKRTHPPAPMSAMDGYAVRLADVQSPNTRLRVIGEAPAGAPFSGSLSAGEAVRLFTGSVIPDGADHVLIQENVTREGDEIVCSDSYDRSAHIRVAGLDFETGETLIAKDTVLTPAHLSMIAASNNSRVEVKRKLRVGLIANGDELKSPGSDLAPGEIINSNPFGLAGLIKSWGAQPIDLGIAGDSEEAIHRALDNSIDIDIFVPIGGASVGDHDHMQAAFRARGYQPVFSKIAVRPGKPTWLSRSKSKCVLGLPGNPASALVCAHLFLAPLLGRPWADRQIRVRLESNIPKNGPREHFMRAAATIAEDGTLLLTPAANQDSSLLHPFLSCNALLRREPNADALSQGAQTDALLIGSLP
ncbi:MAG: molybdopterin molybdotransferase MoeA [Henriciella sp.]